MSAPVSWSAHLNSRASITEPVKTLLMHIKTASQRLIYHWLVFR
jgi:hypothetical protein